MGKRIRVQRRGRGTPTFRALTHRRVAPARYPPREKFGGATVKGVVEALIHDPGRGTPLALIKLENGLAFYNLACEGMYAGQEIWVGEDAPLEVGNILPVSKIPEGVIVYNVEKRPNDGGKFARASGAYAMVVAHTPAGTTIRLTSGKTTVVDGKAYATIGVVAASGRTDKPFMKAGEKYYWVRSRGRKYPITRGVAMIAASHPFGGGRHKHPGKPTTVPKTAPPGRKVGLIAAKTTGRARERRARKVV